MSKSELTSKVELDKDYSRDSKAIKLITSKQVTYYFKSLSKVTANFLFGKSLENERRRVITGSVASIEVVEVVI
ncbi:hypothetical protein COF68_05005 [Bacillus toyonensis]|uniref:hypothetical protein n=1 Tax=Bacillus toyonensis TaxID=155322 RepID=UPI000BFC4568|nr:hypothetical protein [Bacillus toyonensis]PHE64207.1 hypothetical protein COF68_05005 [Bacillus toyonensis]